MRLSAAVIASPCLAGLATALASPLLLFGTEFGPKVPGSSPVEYCNAVRDHESVKIERIDIAPNPPKRGEKLVVTVAANVTKTITKGATVKVTAKNGSVQLFDLTKDLCDELADASLACPVKAGKVTIKKTFDLPSFIPTGTYDVTFDANASGGEKIACVKASIIFSRQ